MRKTADGVLTDNGDGTRTTLLVLLWAFLTLLWSIFTPPHRTFAVRILLFQPLWEVRMHIGDATWVEDLALSLSLHAIYSYWTGAWRFFTLNDFKWIDLNDRVLRLYIQIFSLLGGCGALAGGIVHRGHQLKSPAQNDHLFDRRIDEQLLPPLLIPSRTTHSRKSPTKHTFSYSYLFVGIPVGIWGRVSPALSVDSQERSWFHVSSVDYLNRGHGHLGLADKLKHYLHTQGITDRDYAFAYLITAPRFLGYSFNPVSFWYLYDSDTVLKYMILEVNNTFDERRIYLLGLNSAKHEFKADGTLPDSMLSRSSTLFTETWDKDFHVSPFNSREGSYSLRATDPLTSYQESGQMTIDNTIIFRSSKEDAKVVARVFSDGIPRDASQQAPVQLFSFIASWWWVGLVTFPRIVWQARKLYFQKTLSVWYRPEVIDTSIGRAYTEDEQQLEAFFRAFLEHAVQHVYVPLRVIYKPAHMEGEEVVMYSPGFTFEEDRRRSLTLQVLSPAFYSRFIHYAHAKEAFDRQCLATDDKNRTMLIKAPDLLPTLLAAMHESRDQNGQQKQGAVEQLRWDVLQRLRCPPPIASYPSDVGFNPKYDVTDIRTFRDSELDSFVKHHSETSRQYRGIVVKLFLAQRFAFGIPALISLVDCGLRAVLVWISINVCSHTQVGDVLRLKEWGIQDLWAVAGVLLLANMVHIWSLAKG